jgi:hypothetical protein
MLPFDMIATPSRPLNSPSPDPHEPNARRKLKERRRRLASSGRRIEELFSPPIRVKDLNSIVARISYTNVSELIHCDASVRFQRRKA